MIVILQHYISLSSKLACAVGSPEADKTTSHPTRATPKPHCHHCKIHVKISKFIKIKKGFFPDAVLVLARSEDEAVSQ